MASIDSTTLATSPSSRRPPQLRNLQPRAAAAIDFNDSDDDDGLLSADYKAQRKTTNDLVQFFKNTPPPPPAPTILLSPFPDDDKKKRGLLQRLRPRKGSTSIGPSNGSRSSIAMTGPTSSSISTRSGYTFNSRSPVDSSVGMDQGPEVATLPNGKKYVMIAVNYKDGTSAGASTASITPASGARLSSEGGSAAAVAGMGSGTGTGRQRGTHTVVGQPQHPNIQVTTTIDENSSNGPDKRRSIIIQAGGGDGSVFSLDQTPFLLDNFALDMDFILQPNGSNHAKANASTPSSPSTPSPQSNLSHYHQQASQQQHQQPQQQQQQRAFDAGHDPADMNHQHHFRKRSISTPSAIHPTHSHHQSSTTTAPGRNHYRSPSAKSAQSSYSAGAAEDELLRQGSRQRNKVTFNTAMQHIHSRDDHPSRARDDEQLVSDALMRRLAVYKAQQERTETKEQQTRAAAAAASPLQQDSHQQLTVQPDIVLPKPVYRRKVRHVQIQTQHCIMRPMYTQTEPLADECEPREWPFSSRPTTSTTTTTTTTAMMTTTIAKTTMTTTTTTASPRTSIGTDTEIDALESLPKTSQSLNSSSSASLTCSTSTAATMSSTPTTMTTTQGTMVAVIGQVAPVGQEKGTDTSVQNGTLVTSDVAKENEQLRQQVATLQQQMQLLERDLASETRARARTTAAMQDTREKFEMLSAMAYKKLKELIFQRHVLEMEVRELRDQVDLQADEHEQRQTHQHQYQQQIATHVAV